MTWNLNEPFDTPTGQWQDFAPTDSTENSSGVDDFLHTQQHTDLRNFRIIAALVPVPQTDLEAVAQTVLDGETQTDMEVKFGAAIQSENWELSATDGTNDDLFVGKIASFGGWSGAHFTTDGNPLAATLQSVTEHAVDITLIDTPELRITFPDYDQSGLDQDVSYVQLCSGGDFGGGHDSAQVPLTSSTGGANYILLDTSLFAASGFDPSAVTGVLLHLEQASPPAADTDFTIMAIRIEDTATWDGGNEIDFDTLLGAICFPVPFDGTLPPPTATNADFEFVRGDGSADDPIPADVAMNMYFSPGGETSPDDATSGTYNQIGFIFREHKDTGAGTGDHIFAGLKWEDTDTTFIAYHVSTTGGSPGTPTITGDFSDDTTPILDPTKNYVFHVELIGTSITAAIYETDLNHVIGALVWQLGTTLSDPAYAYGNGRVGYMAGLVSRDAYVDEITVSPVGFATLESEVFESHTPVDGAQLAAIFSQDINLWNGYTGSDILIDQTKTLSGTGSFRTALGLTTNTFVVEDWTETYFDFQIWVPGSVTLANQPVVVLNTSGGPEHVVIQKLQPAQWNFVHCDLTTFQNLINGVGYSLSINAASSPDKPLGNFWVDETVIGRRRVRWAVRAQANGTYREFKDMINNPRGAVHLNTNERGSDLQIKAVALTEDAWVSSFKLFPHYAQLGNALYDPVFFNGTWRDA